MQRSPGSPTGLHRFAGSRRKVLSDYFGDGATAAREQPVPTSSAAGRSMPPPPTPPSWRGTRPLVLAALVAQNSALVLTMRYARTRGGEMYLASAAVICDEGLKLLICLGVLALGALRRGKSISSHLAHQGLCDELADWLKVAVVALAYVVQKNLLYLAVSNLDAAVFQIVYQFKTVSTALFSIGLLDRRFSTRQLSAMLLLTVGLMLVELDHAMATTAPPPPEQYDSLGHLRPPLDLAAAAAAAVGSSETHQGMAPWRQSHALGLAAVAGCCCTSGFGCVYFERVLKGGGSTAPKSVFAKNLQLGTFSFAFAFAFGLLHDGATIASRSKEGGGFFTGFGALVWCTIVLESLGGLLVGFVLRYTDAMLKTFATALSIVLSVLLSSPLLGFRPTTLFVVGGALVLFASVMYGMEAPPRQATANSAAAAAAPRRARTESATAAQGERAPLLLAPAGARQMVERILGAEGADDRQASRP
eukprot:SAG11_NODE_599_length_8269_cov_3.455080_7_plen_476_part_00